MADKYTEKEIGELGLWMRHFQCGGGGIEQICTVQILGVDVATWKCKKCGAEYDSSDYKEHAGYWAKKYDKGTLQNLLPEVFAIANNGLQKTPKDGEEN